MEQNRKKEDRTEQNRTEQNRSDQNRRPAQKSLKNYVIKYVFFLASFLQQPSNPATQQPSKNRGKHRNVFVGLSITKIIVHLINGKAVFCLGFTSEYLR